MSLFCDSFVEDYDLQKIQREKEFKNHNRRNYRIRIHQAKYVPSGMYRVPPKAHNHEFQMRLFKTEINFMAKYNYSPRRDLVLGWKNVKFDWKH
jgi:hypothetical protein